MVSCPTILDLPNDLLLDVIKRTASESLKDLLSVKMTCTLLKELGDDHEVYQCVKVQQIDFESQRHSPHRNAFLMRCCSCGNLMALYKVGMVSYFKRSAIHADGLALLRCAANKGHVCSMYTYSLIIISNLQIHDGTDEVVHAMGYLHHIRFSRQIVQCRIEVGTLLLRLLRRGMHLYLVDVPIRRVCTQRPCPNRWRPRRGALVVSHDDDDEKDKRMCEACRWDYEKQWFYLRLNLL